MAKVRMSKNELQFYVIQLKKKGYSCKLFKTGRNFRIYELLHKSGIKKFLRVTSNSWVEIS